MDAMPNRSAAGHGEQLCVVLRQGGGLAHYWSVLDWRSRDAIGFRGFSARFQPSPIAREVIDFTVAGPIGCLSDLEDVALPQAIEMAGSVAAPPVPLTRKLLVAPAPQVSPVGGGPHGRFVDRQGDRGGHGGDRRRHSLRRGSDLRHPGRRHPGRGDHGGPALANALTLSTNSSGNLVLTITTPIGRIDNKPFISAPGLPATDR